MDTAAKASAGWRRVRLDEVLIQHADEVPVQHDQTYDIAGVYSFGRGVFGRAALEGSATSYRTLHRLREGQLVMSRVKAWEGAVAVVPADFDGWFLSPEFPTFDIDSRQVDTDYFRSLITSAVFWSRLSNASRGIGARRERVHAMRLLEQEIDLPPLSTQRSVASVLSVLGDIEARRSFANERMDALLPAALNEAFASLG
jgi:type I restriction enzyme S subunit